MAEFVYNNIKNVSIGYTFFELNYRYHPHNSFEDDSNLCSKSYSVEELDKELRGLMPICEQNLFHAQKI